MDSARSRTTLLACAALFAAGCATASAPAGPEAVARAWAEADAPSAERWVVPGGEAWPRDPEAAAPPAVEDDDLELLERRARWPLPGGGALVVEADGDGPRIAAGVLGFRRASTPAEAALLLARAVRTGDWALLRSLLPAEERSHWTPARLAAAVRHPSVREAWEGLAAAIVAGLPEATWLDDGRRARLEAGETTLVLVAEPDGWKVLDVRPAGTYTPSP
ncbi:MAG: hypothetical protein ACQEXJ_11260 [Myxococcota bacterium]